MKEPTDFLRLLMLIVLGAALLLLSAVAEGGTTEMSRALVRRMADVPEMIEALIICVAAIAAGGAGAAYINKNSR